MRDIRSRHRITRSCNEMGSVRTTAVANVVKVAFVFLLVVGQLDGVASAGGTTSGRKERRPAGPSGGTTSSPSGGTTSSPSAGSTSSGSSSKSGAASEFTADDFHDLTDKLTQKLMMDIDKYKAEDPNWGKPPKVDEQGDDEDMDQEPQPPSTECDFECPDGKIPEPNPDYKMPKFKNCKDYDRTWDRIPGASTCCARHQKCYHTCLRERPLCDQEFGACMEGICENLQEEGRIGSEEVVKACQAAMGLLGMIVMEPGCKMYPDAQSVACNCVKWESPGSNQNQPAGSAGTVTGSKKKKKKQRSEGKSEEDSCSIDEPACDGEETTGENRENVQQKSQRQNDMGGDKKSGSKPRAQDEAIDLTKDEL